MKISGRLDLTKSAPIRKEMPLSEVRFRIPRRRLIRQSILSVVLIVGIGCAMYLQFPRF